MSCSRLSLLALLSFFTGCASAPASPAASASDVTSASATTASPREDAQTALRAARPALRACRRSTQGMPVMFEATLEFEPSGKVSRVTIEPAGPVADCVRSDLTQVEIRSFEGPPLEVQIQVTL